jgi:hypothetical protein
MPLAAKIISTKDTTSAIVAGSTGAVGRELVVSLVADPTVRRVVALTRVEVPRELWAEIWPKINMELAAQKLKVSVMDWEKCTKCFDARRKAEKKRAKAEAAGEVPPGDGPSIQDEIPIVGYNREDFEGHDFAANCIGTTFWKAKTLWKFHRVDHDYTLTFMRLVMLHSGHGTHYSQISYNGADRHSILPYQRIKGKTEKEVLEFGFGKVTVFRPGMLARRSKKRFSERLGTFLLLAKTPVEIVASAVISEWRGLYQLPDELEHKIHCKLIYEAAGNYSARRRHEDTAAAASNPKNAPRKSSMYTPETSPAAARG